MELDLPININWNESMIRGRSLKTIGQTLVVMLTAWLVSFGSYQSVVAQNRAAAEDDEQILEDTFLQAEQSVFIPAPREFIRPLIRANRAIDENDPARAVSLLGEVLSDSTGEDYLVPLKGVDGVSVSLRLRAESILGKLPAKDRELYRLRYGVQAKQLLEQAIAAGDFDGVSQVMQRFFFTRAGFDAAMLLGHHYLDQGRPVAAANCFKRIATSREARAVHDPEASVLLATCWMMVGSRKRATDVLVDLRRNTRKNSIRFLGKPIQLFDDPKNAADWLLKLVGDSRLRNIELVNQWVMAGGNPQRNARNGMGLPLINPRWETPTLNDPDMEKVAIGHQRDLVFLDSAPIPAVQPLAIGNTVVMRSFDRMIGVDFKTGKRVWEFPPRDFAAEPSRSTDPTKNRIAKNDPLKERLWLDSVYGQSSSDGKRIFLVPNPGFSRAAGDGFAGDKNQLAVTRHFNELMAIDIEREGAFRWEVGGESGLDEPKLAKAFFLGPPLPLDDDLYAVCQHENLIKLVALDPETGKLQWQQPLGTTENNRVDLSDDRFRRLASISPSFANGILVCATGTGALTAIDLSTRSLLWGFQYTNPSSKAVSRISPRKGSNSDPFGGIWRDSSIIIADGKVIYTPVETQQMVCVDLQTGYSLWNTGHQSTAVLPRNDSLFLACVENGNAILVGETSIRAIDLNTGRERWQTPTTQHGKPSGRGYANNGFYYYPVTTRQMLQVNLNDGQIVKSIRTNGVLGNLICYRGDVISHGAERLAVFPQDEPNRRLLADAESSGNVTHELLAIKAQLQIQEGNLANAIESIQLAYNQQPARAYEKILLDLIVQLIEEDFESSLELTKRYQPLLLEHRRIEYLTANVNGMIRQKRYEEALDALLGLLNPISELPNLSSQSVSISALGYDKAANQRQSATTQQEKSILSSRRSDTTSATPEASQKRIDIRLDQWIASRIRLLHDEAPEELKVRIGSSIAEVIRSVAAQNLGPVETYSVTRIFPLEQVPADHRLRLSSRLIAEGETLRATQLLNSLTTDSTSPLAGPALAISAEMFLGQTSHERVLPILERLEQEFGDQLVNETQTGIDFAKDMRQRTELENPNATSNSQWHHGDVISSQETTPHSIDLVPCTVNLVDYDSPEFENYQFQFYGQTGEIEIIDGNGETVHRFFARKKLERVRTNYNSYVFGRISIHNNLAVLDIAKEIFVFDWLKLKNGENPVLWNKAVQGAGRYVTVSSVPRQWGEVQTSATSRNYGDRVYVSAPSFDGVCYLDNTQLICMDPFTGEKIWQRSSILPGSVLLGDEDHVVVYNPKLRTADVIATPTGRLIKTTTLGVNVGAAWTWRGSRILVSTVQRQLTVEPATRSKALPSIDDPPKKPILMERTLGLFDLLTDEFVWRSTYPLKTRGCLVQRNRIAILQPRQDLDILDIQTGKPLFTTELRLEKVDRQRITGIGVAVRDNNYLFHFKKGDTANNFEVDGTGIKYVNYRDIMWVGHMIFVDSKTGNNLWRSPVRFDNFQICSRQPANTPIHFLLRRITKEDSSGVQRQYINFAGIDIETGSLLVNSLSPYNYRFSTRFTCNPELQQVKIAYFENTLTFKLTNSLDTPPRMVAHLANYNSIPGNLKKTLPSNFDKAEIELEISKSLAKAKAAQGLLPARQAEERKLLESEKQNPEQ